MRQAIPVIERSGGLWPSPAGSAIRDFPGGRGTCTSESPNPPDCEGKRQGAAGLRTVLIYRSQGTGFPLASAQNGSTRNVAQSMHPRVIPR